MNVFAPDHFVYGVGIKYPGTVATVLCSDVKSERGVVINYCFETKDNTISVPGTPQ